MWIPGIRSRVAMIWFRRLLTIPLIIFLFFLLIVVLLVTNINDTAANPKFYQDQMREADIYNFVYDEILPAALDDMETDDPWDITIDISDIEGDIVSAVEKILPPEWLQAQVESATDTIFPYILGDTDHFTYTLVLKDRVEMASQVIKSDILQGYSFTYIYDEGVSYLADELLENLDELPYPLTLSKEEIENSLRTVIPQDWITARLGAAIDSIIPYITGDTDHFTITMPLQDRVDAATAAAADLGVIDLLEEYLEEARDLTSEDWTFTDADLLDELDSDDRELLEDIRGWIDDGYTIRETDLREAVADTGEDLEIFDNVRYWTGTARTWLWVLWLVPILLLVIIGLLCGRSWRGRLVWALAVFILVSATVYITVDRTYAAISEPNIQDIFDPADYAGVDAVMADKGNEVIENASSGFVSGVKGKALYIMIGSSVGILGVIGWSVLSRRYKPGTSEDIRCPECGSKTVLRTSKKGPNAGRTFHVCARYPECRGKVAVEKQIVTEAYDERTVTRTIGHTMHCTNCGGKIDYQARFCTSCGAAIQATSEKEDF